MTIPPATAQDQQKCAVSHKLCHLCRMVETNRHLKEQFAKTMNKYEISFSWKKKKEERKEVKKKNNIRKLAKQGSIYFQVVLRADAFRRSCITIMDITVKFWKFSLLIENS